jgi:hypothetical protein
MESIFINAGLAAGAALAAVPVILHMFMRQTPKHIIFPALRLIRERQKRSRKKLRIKNWLLLLARMALLVLMALALARPRLWSRTTLGDSEIPSAIAFVFDTSLSMGYKERDKTRLDEAKDRARDILKKAHEASRIYVIDSAVAILPEPLSPANALKRIDALTLSAVNRQLNGAVGLAYKAVASAEQPRHEVFVMTDLARSAWDLTRPSEGLEQAAKDKTRISTFVMRLSPKSVRDVAVVEAEPMTEFVSKDDPVPIKVRLRSTGQATNRVAEFWLDGVKRGDKLVDLPADGEIEVRFVTPKLTTGLVQGEVRVAGPPDPLDQDDRRYFTLDVKPPLRVLVIYDNAIDADFVADAIDPRALPAGEPRPFRVTRMSTRDVETKLESTLKDYACVFLLNVATLPESAWGRLNGYVHEGGGLVIGLGDRVVPDSLKDSGATQLFPAVLKELKTPKEPTFTFGRADTGHPLFEHDTRELLAELSAVPILRYRAVTPNEGSRTLLAYQNNDAALLERVFPGARSGHVLLWTTALARRPGNTAKERSENWNEFPNPLAGWSFVYLMNATVPYLSGASGEKLTYEAGEDIRLPLDPGHRYSSYTVQPRGGKPTDKLSEPVAGASLVIQAPPTVGHWEVLATGPSPDSVPARRMGFSVNPPGSESVFSVLDTKDLDGLFGGKDRYNLADDPESLRKVITVGRLGRELFPLLMLLILLVVTAENVLANTFYRDRTSVRAQPVAA